MWDNSRKRGTRRARSKVLSVGSLTAGLANIARFNATRHLLPICGARGRTSGEPCRNLPMENGRCRFHGGAVPRGAAWHKATFSPAPGKLDKKLSELHRREKRRLQRLAAMTPEERASYEAWLAAHRPGSRALRQAAKRNRETSALLAEIIHRPAPPPADLVDLEQKLDAARRRRDLMTAEQVADSVSDREQEQ
jgi:hypothetical protein